MGTAMRETLMMISAGCEMKGASTNSPVTVAAKLAYLPLVANWNLTQTSVPAVHVQVSSTEQVVQVCENVSKFPSPVLAVGSLHSVNSCLTNNGGTILNLSGMNNILGLEAAGVRVQAGVKLADLHDWLARQKGGLEISFSPEIGDATVGSLAVTTSKDSSINGPGYLSGLINEIVYVDEVGRVVVLTKAKTPMELLEFTCSYGMMGIVVEVVLAVRPRAPITTRSCTAHASDGQAAAKAILQAHNNCDALFAILVPSRKFVYLELRHQAGSRKLLASNKALSYLAVNEPCRNVLRFLKYRSFLRGSPPGPALSKALRLTKALPMTHYRRAFVNRYPAVESGSQRLDFSFVEFDLCRLEAIVAGCWEFHVAYEAATGFAPGGYGMYFVYRGWNQQHLGDKNGKPHGNFSRGPPGFSFMLDPITSDCDNPQWQEFNEAYTTWAISQGGQPSLSQTKGLQPGQATLPRHLTRPRFLTSYYAKFTV
eukprot:gene8748-8928_t